MEPLQEVAGEVSAVELKYAVCLHVSRWNEEAFWLAVSEQMTERVDVIVFSIYQ